MSQAEGVRLPSPVEAAGSSRLAALMRRLLSTLVLLPLFVWMVVEGPMWLFGTVMVLVGALGQWEFTGMFERAGVRTFRVIGLLGGAVLTASFALPVSERVTFTAVLLAILAIGLPYMASAFGIFLLRQTFKTVPRELDEAARVEGARFRKV